MFEWIPPESELVSGPKLVQDPDPCKKEDPDPPPLFFFVSGGWPGLAPEIGNNPSRTRIRGRIRNGFRIRIPVKKKNRIHHLGFMSLVDGPGCPRDGKLSQLDPDPKCVQDPILVKRRSGSTTLLFCLWWMARVAPEMGNN